MADKKQVALNFSRSARDYEKHALLQRRLADELFHQLTADNLRFTAVLDIGCGTGYLAFKLAKHFPGAQVLGIDIAPGMIEVAKNRYKAKNLVFEIADGEKLKLPPSFDLIVSNASLQWMDSKAVFNHVKKLLTVGGRFIFNTFGPRTLIEMRNCGFRVNDFPSIDEIRKSLDGKFKILSLGSRKIKQKFQSVKELVCHLREIGANTPQTKAVSAGKALRSGRAKRPIAVSYEIIYGHGRIRGGGLREPSTTAPGSMFPEPLSQ